MSTHHNISKQTRRVSLLLAASYFAMALVVAFHYHAGGASGSAVVGAQSGAQSHALHGSAHCHVAWYAVSAFTRGPVPPSSDIPPFSAVRLSWTDAADRTSSVAHRCSVRGPPRA